MTPSIEGIPEMGWLLAPHAHGRGIATEAILAALDWADRGGLPGPEIVAIIDAANLASIRVAEKAGFSTREDATYNNAPIQLFRRRR
jgi:RimJ/RimL family protein N-acetyltransferase